MYLNLESFLQRNSKGLGLCEILTEKYLSKSFSNFRDFFSHMDVNPNLRNLQRKFLRPHRYSWFSQPSQ